MSARASMLLVTPAQLAALYQCPFVRAANFAPHLNQAMWAAAIVTPARIRAFLAQLGHESGRLRYVREIWGPTPQQLRYERDPAAAWPPTRDDQTNRLAWRLGNHEEGDGKRFMGRGLIQTTGRANYARLSAALTEDFVTYPGLLERVDWACLSAAQYWSDHDLNALADAGEFDRITQAINGGQTGRRDRVALHDAAQAVIA